MESKTAMTRTICFVAGKSGGHLIPGLTLARMEKKQDPTTYIMYISTCSTLDYHIVSASRSIDRYIQLNLPNVPTTYLSYIWYTILCARSFFSILYLFITQRPQDVISMGGYISIPVCLAAWIVRIPITLWELNAIPGKATSYLQWFARTIKVCFPNSVNYFSIRKTIVTAYPIQYCPTIRFLSSTDSRAQLQLQPDIPTILILGGSQGSVQLNHAFGQWLDNTANKPVIQVIHQTGDQDHIDWQQWYQQRALRAITFSFQHDISLYYKAADLVICRAGSGTLHEIIWFDLPAIVVPLITTTNNHQYYNALAAQETKSNLQVSSPQTLGAAITQLLIK